MVFNLDCNLKAVVVLPFLPNREEAGNPVKIGSGPATVTGYENRNEPLSQDGKAR